MPVPTIPSPAAGSMLAQVATLSATTLFYLTLLIIFISAIVTAVATKWSRDKCLKLFGRYHVTLERTRGQTIWGSLRVFSSGIEMAYDAPFVDPRGRRKTSYLIYQQEIDQQVLTLFRYHDELDESQQRERRKQVHRTFNPGPIRRMMRGVRNFVNTLRDAFNNAIGAAIGQYQRMNPANALLTQQAGSFQQIGQTLLGKFAGNAYEPLLEQYIGRPVILDVVDPINPNNTIVEYVGYLADYTQQFVAIFNVEHETAQEIELTLPNVEQGEPLPPLPPPPPPGAPAPTLPPPLNVQHELAVRVDGLRFKIMNVRHEPVVVRRLEREGLEPIVFGSVIPPNGTLDLPARDARGGKLVVEIIRCMDVLAPRKWATIRHAGTALEPRGLVEEMHLDQLPRVPKLFHGSDSNGKPDDAKARRAMPSSDDHPATR